MEETIIRLLNSNIEFFTYFGSYILFIAGFVESMPVFGFLVPGQTLILIGGFIAKFSGGNFLFFFLAGAFGAIVGDILAYFLGKKYGYSVLKIFGGNSIKPIYIEQTKKLLNEHTGKTLILGRFNSLTRSLAPFIAGTANVSFAKFLYFTLIGVVSWAFSFCALGYLLGASFDILGLAIGKFFSFVTIIVTLILLFGAYVKKNGFKITNKEITSTGYALISLYVFAAISHKIFKARHVPHIDANIHRYFIENPTFISFMKVITHAGDKWFIVFLTLVLCVFLWLKKKKKDAVVFASSVFLGALSIATLKTFFLRDRPDLSYITESGSGFPSGHSLISAVFFTGLYLIFSKYLKGYKKVILLLISITFPLLIAFSRIALGVHFLSDVLAGLALGIFISRGVEILAKFLPWIYKRVKNKEVIPNL